MFKNFKILIKEFLKNFLLSIKCFFKKSNIVTISIFVLLSLATTISGTLFPKGLNGNKSQTIYEIANSYYENTSNNPVGILYPKKMTNVDCMVYRTPENSKLIRNTIPDAKVFDLYQSNWLGLYSPGIVNYEDKQNVDISFFSFPRLYTYITPSWQYNMPLLYPQGNSPLNDFRSPNDIFINKKYAQYLLKKYNKNLDDYGFLCSNNLNEEDKIIPYKWNFGSGEKYTEKRINVLYNIKGVIDSDSEEYLEYSEIFGDFFIVDEYYSLPIPSITYFELKMNTRNDLKIIDTLLKTYQYKSEMASSAAYTSLYSYDYRISFVGKKDSDFSIDNIASNQSLYTIKTNQTFDFYFSKENLLFLISFLAINIIFFGLTLFYSYRLYSKIKVKSFSTFTAIILAVLLSIVFICALFISNLLNRFVPLFSKTSCRYIFSLLIPFIELLLSLFMFLFPRLFQKRN